MNYNEYKEAYNALNLPGDRLLKGALSLGTEYREFELDNNISEAGDVLCAIMLIDTHYNLSIDIEKFKSFKSSSHSVSYILNIQEYIKKYECNKEMYLLMTVLSHLMIFLETFLGRALAIAPLSEIFEYNINKLKNRI